MSTILDALRKAHAARGAEPAAAPTPDLPATEASPVSPVLEAATPPPIPDPPDPNRQIALQTAAQIEGSREEEEKEEGEKVTEEPAPPSSPPPDETPGSFPEDPPSYLPLEDDAGPRRRFITQAAAVIAVGVLLGLLVGRRFTSTPAEDGDELLSDAALRTAAVEKTDAEPKPVTPPAAPVTAAPKPDVPASPSPPTAEAAPVAPVAPAREIVPAAEPEGADSEGKGSRADRGARGDKKRRGGAAGEGNNDAPVAASPKPAPMPQQALPVAPIVPVPKATAPVPEAPPSPPPPIELPPPPDDAPALSLLFIQWSADAAKRVASLRQNEGGAIYIVREGDVVQGLRIAAIRPSALEIQWRGQYFLLPAARY